AASKGGTIAQIGHLLGQLLTFFCCLLFHHIQSLLPLCRLHAFSFSQLHCHEFVLHPSQVDQVSREEDFKYVWLALKLSLLLSRYRTQ
ncbi:hypothetical protein GT037_008807, partial [Alternaria burnsii]